MSGADHKQFLRAVKSDGWTAEVTNGGHMRLRHHTINQTMVIASTPSDHRAVANNKARLRRILRSVAPVLPPPLANPSNSRKKKKPAKRQERRAMFEMPGTASQRHAIDLGNIADRVRHRRSFVTDDQMHVIGTPEPGAVAEAVAPPDPAAARELRQAWRLTLMGLRNDRRDWPMVAIMKKRFRQDDTYRAGQVDVLRRKPAHEQEAVRRRFLSRAHLQPLVAPMSAPRPPSHLAAVTPAIAAAVLQTNEQPPYHAPPPSQSPAPSPSPAPRHLDELAEARRQVADLQSRLVTAERQAGEHKQALVAERMKNGVALQTRDASQQELATLRAELATSERAKRQVEETWRALHADLEREKSQLVAAQQALRAVEAGLAEERRTRAGLEQEMIALRAKLAALTTEPTVAKPVARPMPPTLMRGAPRAVKWWLSPAAKAATARTAALAMQRRA